MEDYEVEFLEALAGIDFILKELAQNTNPLAYEQALVRISILTTNVLNRYKKGGEC